MKRIIIYFICGIMAVVSQAQIVSTVSSFTKIEKEKKERVPMKFEFYGKIGLNIMNGTFDSHTEDYFSEGISYKSKVGFDLNFGFMSHFRPSNPSDFYWGAELGLTQIGIGYDEFITDYSYVAYNYPSNSSSVYGVVISPAIGWKKEIANDTKIDLHFNPGYLFRCEDLSIPGIHYWEYSDEYYEFNEYIGDPHYASFKLGIGIWYRQLNLDLSYRKVTTFDQEWDFSFSNLILSAGIRF